MNTLFDNIDNDFNLNNFWWSPGEETNNFDKWLEDNCKKAEYVKKV